MEDRSLDDFSEDGDDSPEGRDDSFEDGDNTAEAKADTPSGSEDADGGTEPGQPTSQWAPEGRSCPDCNTSARRLWRMDGRLVCADCKDWG